MIGSHPCARSCGGPLIVMPHDALPSWEGTRPPANGRVIEVAWQFDPSGPATDYDRACDAPGLISTISVGPHDALVLGSFTDNATILWSDAGECTIVRLVSVEDDARFEAAVRTLPGTDFPPSEVSWNVTGGALRVFDSASSRPARLRSDDCLDFTLEPGRYAIHTLRYEVPDIAEAVLHRLARIG